MKEKRGNERWDPGEIFSSAVSPTCSAQVNEFTPTSLINDERLWSIVMIVRV